MPPPDSGERRPLVIKNGIVVTMDDQEQVHFDGTVAIRGDLIADVGPTALVLGRSGDLSGARVIDARDKVVMPGLVDLHYHTAIGRGWSDHLPLWEALQEFWYPVIRALDPDAVYWAALASYSESIRCGVTTVNDMYRHLDGLARAAEEVGIRAVISSVTADPEHHLDSLEDNERGFRSSHGAANGRVRVFVGIEWLPLASTQLLAEASAMARDLGTSIHIHLNESAGEVQMSVDKFGQRPTEVAFEQGILGPRCVAAHCVWLSEREISLMHETGTHISHNPSSNAKLGNGVAPLVDLLSAGINVGLGHDSTEGTNTADLFQVMKFASLMQRAVRQETDLLQAPDLLRMATRNGGRALGGDVGELAVGKKADVILIDLKDPVFTPLMPENKNQLFSHLAFAATGPTVDTAVIDGRVVMSGREIVTLDEQKVLREANRAFARILERSGVRG